MENKEQKQKNREDYFYEIEDFKKSDVGKIGILKTQMCNGEQEVNVKVSWIKEGEVVMLEDLNNVGSEQFFGRTHHQRFVFK